MHRVIALLPVLLMIFIAATYFLVLLPMPLIGDDMAFSAGYESRFGSSPLYYPYWAAHHYFISNGRMADKFNPLLFNFCPRVVLSLLCGAILFLFLWLLDRWCFPRRGNFTSARILLLGIVVFTFPWWDSFMLYVCHFNYVWTSALTLLFLYILLRTREPRHAVSGWLLCLFAFMAGGMHEGAGPALAGGLVCWLITTHSYRGMSRFRRYYLACFFAGALFTVVSPGFLHRFSGLGDATPDDPFLILILKSDFYALALLLTLLLASAIWRRRLTRLIHSYWIIFAVAALLSMIVSGVSGIVGRSGWFAQVFALIALFRFFQTFRPRISRRVAVPASSVLAAAIILHLSLFIHWQNIASEQLSVAIDTFRANPDRIVYLDFIRDPDYPWYILSRQKSVMDEDDDYYLRLTETFYGKGHKMTILPAAASRIDFSTVSLPVEIGGGTVDIDTITSGEYVVRDKYGILVGIPNRPVSIGGKDYMQVPFTQNGLRLIFTVERNLEPGERP